MNKIISQPPIEVDIAGWDPNKRVHFQLLAAAKYYKIQNFKFINADSEGIYLCSKKIYAAVVRTSSLA